MMKNSRQNSFHQPILGFSHDWENDNSTLNTSALFTSGNRGQTDLDFTDNVNYNWIGSASRQNPILWDSIYSDNMSGADKRSKYIIDKNSSNRTMISLNSVYDLLEWGNFETTGGIEAKLYFGRYYNEVYDLLAGSHWLNVDKFVTPPSNPDFYQFDINQPDRKILTDGRIGHDYSIRQQSYKLWNVWRYYIGTFKYSLGGSASYLSYGYTGNIKNGKVDNSGEKRPEKKFFNFSGKAGAAYKLSQKSDVEINAMYSHRAPLFANAYLSPRISGNLLPRLTNEKILSAEANYITANTIMDVRVSAFFTWTRDQSLVRSFYDNDYLSHLDMGLSGLDSRYIGGEASARFNIAKGLKADFAASYGIYKYVSDPNVVLLQENINTINLADTLRMKGLSLSNTPQMAISAGLLYESTLNFWLGLNLSYSGQNFASVNPLTLSYSAAETNDTQEQLKLSGVFTLNLKGGYVFPFPGKHKRALSLNINADNLLGAKGILGAYSPLGLEKTDVRYAYIYGRTMYLTLRFIF
jgi:hypothetical protein